MQHLSEAQKTAFIDSLDSDFLKNLTKTASDFDAMEQFLPY